jgi:nucleotide-binding universal stress UspA family protein
MMAASRKPMRILVPVDFSEGSERAIHYARWLAGPLGATLTLLHVWDAPIMIPAEAVTMVSGTLVSFSEMVRASAAKELDALRASWVGRGVDLEIRLARGYAPDVITRLGAEYDLIAMGSHGRTGFARAFLGSVAERVVGTATVPVLTVRSPANPAKDASSARADESPAPRR